MSKPTPRVHVVQLLCPQRHCVMAAFYEDLFATFEETKAQMDEAREAMGINPYCGLCLSRDLRYEDAVTKYANLTAAAPLIEEQAVANQVTRLLFGNKQEPNQKN